MILKWSPNLTFGANTYLKNRFCFLVPNNFDFIEFWIPRSLNNTDFHYFYMVFVNIAIFASSGRRIEKSSQKSTPHGAKIETQINTNYEESESDKHIWKNTKHVFACTFDWRTISNKNTFCFFRTNTCSNPKSRFRRNKYVFVDPTSRFRRNKSNCLVPNHIFRPNITFSA